MSNIAEINNLEYKDLFQKLCLKIEKNKFVTISGSNNCGKTTLIRILNKEIESSHSIKIMDKLIEEFPFEQYAKIIQTIIPTEIIFLEKNLADELHYLCLESEKEKETFINYLLTNLKAKKIANKDFNILSKKEIILSQIAVALINKPKLLLLDNIDIYFTKDEIKNILLFLNSYKEKHDLTVIITTVDLEISLFTDYLYIIDNKKIALEGAPLEILQKDNIINKIGLNVPFMIDLSVKLKDYELLKNIELDIDRMVDTLWN